MHRKDKGNLENLNVGSDMTRETQTREGCIIEPSTVRKWKKIAWNIISDDAPMQLIVLTKRTRSQEKPSQPELPKKKI